MCTLLRKACQFWKNTGIKSLLIPSYSYGIAASIIKNNAIEDLYLNETAITAILVCNSYKTVAEKEKFIEEYVKEVKKEYSDEKE